MLFRSIRFFFLIFSLAFSSSLLAQDNYQQWVDDITARLDKTSQLIQQGNTDDARTEVQMAYFEVFENLEGPIRINFSAQKSYQMEATFGEIRKMIGEGASQKEIQAKIDQLKKELQEVLPSLVEGHQLNADGQHGVYDNQAITPYWQQSFKTIDDLIAQGIDAYQNGDLANAKKLFQQAQYDGYKNSEMEMSIRQNRSAEISAAINQQFYNIIRLSEQADQITKAHNYYKILKKTCLTCQPHEKNKTFNLMRHSKQLITNKSKIGIRLNKRSINVFNRLLRSINKVKAKKRFFPYKTPISTCLKVQEWKTKWVPVIVTLKQNLKATLLV